MISSTAFRHVFSRGNCIHPRSRFVRLTSRCNQRCAFCNIRGDEAFDLTETEAGTLVDAALARDPAAVVHFTGGEPTLRRDLVRLAQRARSGGARRVFLQTNALRLATLPLASALAAGGVTDLIVSHHAPDAARSDALTAAPGTFALTRQGIANALALGLGVWPNLVLTVANLADGPATVRAIARDFPAVNGVILSTVQPHGLARSNGAAVVPRLAAVARSMRRTIAACDRVHLRYHLSYCENPLCFVLAATGERARPEEVRGYVRRRLAANGCLRCHLLGEMAKDKTKPARCTGCGLAEVCFGIWRAQIEIHGVREVRPVGVAGRRSRWPSGGDLRQGPATPGAAT
ncbi:MAG: radical SAM protein [Deltaproteobacteria bacterium]|nr:radical SAM protein [Deltaproteobacteria bacterium]